MCSNFRAPIRFEKSIFFLTVRMDGKMDGQKFLVFLFRLENKEKRSFLIEMTVFFGTPEVCANCKNSPVGCFAAQESPDGVKKEQIPFGICSLVRQKGLEPPTFWFVAKHSIQLSYWRILSFGQLSYNSTAV